MPPMLGRELSSLEARQAGCRRLRCPPHLFKERFEGDFRPEWRHVDLGGLEHAPNPPSRS